MAKHTITDRVTHERRCSCFKRCGGCQLDMTYKQQLEWKQSKAQRMLSRFCKVQDIIAMEQPYNYRNKVQTVYRRTSSGRLISGVYQSSSRSVTAVDDCMLEDTAASEVVTQLKRLFVSFKLTPYDECTGRGVIRHTLIRVAKGTGEVMLVIVTNGAMFPSKRNFVKALLEKCPFITTIVQNISDEPLPLTLGRRNVVLYGKGKIVDELCGCKFLISPESFYQVNHVQTEALYSEAVKAAGIDKDMLVLDAYCGVGTIGMICAKQGARVLGIESNQAAVKDAITNAKLNGLDNISFVCADATQMLCELAYKGEKCDVLIMDPPRAGSTQEFISAVAAISPQTVVYVSCKIETLERDLKIFSKCGYKARLIQPIDMFPHTTGIETVVLLNKKAKENSNGRENRKTDR